MNTQSGARLAGPRDPETFFRAQKRNRRATWRMSALSMFAALIMGVPLTLVLTPLLYVLTMVVAEIVNYFSPLPPEFFRNANSLAQLGLRVADFVINQRGRLDPQELAFGVALLLLPGMVLTFLLWTGTLTLFRRGGVGGMLATLNARPPNQGDLKELQLADVAQEMAVAAGLPCPQVMLIDSPGANAAVIGTSVHDARIVLSRRLLDDLDRNQLQAVIAHLVGSIGNGDLGIAFTVTSVFETCGLLVNMINVPFSKDSRHRLWRVVRYIFSRAPADALAAEAGEIAESLGTTLDANVSDSNMVHDGGQPGPLGKFTRVVLFPLVFTNLAVEITLWFFLNILLGPCMALLWRTRRYLADASAVELTRNPDALATALHCLSEDTTAVGGGGWATHLFVVDPKGDSGLRGMPPSDDQKRKAISAWLATEPGSAPATTNQSAAVDTADFLRMRTEMISTAKAAMTGDGRAVERMAAFAQLMGSDPALGLGAMPSLADLAAARRGDAAALQRIQALRQTSRQEGRPARGQTGLQMESIISFHPQLKRRAKRLQKMGAQMMTPGGYGLGTKIAFVVLWLIIGPLLTAAGAMMLMVIAMMIMLNLVMLSAWLAIIHGIFSLLAHH